jgi:cation:H+ antiporter
MLTLAGLVLLGLVCLVLGAEWFVRGAAALAVAFGVSPLVIGLTVVAYGTSMPELVVSALAALDGRSAIALGNVVGSNIANIGLILGVTAMLAPPQVDGSLVRREVPVLVGTAIGLPLLLLDGTIGRPEALLLLVGAIGFTVLSMKAAREDGLASPPGASSRTRGALTRAIGVTVAGLVLLIGGGRWFVQGASAMAALLGVSERVIGLTVVAVGTSLPELAASVVAALRGMSSIAIGNVVGSNIFNILFVLGGAGLVAPVTGEVEVLRLDLFMMMAFTVLAAVLMRGSRRISRLEGTVLLLGYAGAMVLLARGGG